jgi:type VI secretion system (T6SS) effector TldE1-like protein
VRDAKLHGKPSGRAGGLGIRSSLISAGIVVLALGFAPVLQAGRIGASISETSQSKHYDWQAEFAASSIEETGSAAASFDERFTGAVDSRGGRSARDSAPLPTLPPAATMKPLRVADASAEEDSSLLSDAAARVAIYDIAAHQVYLPDGRRLEAHSGLGRYRDDPRRVSEKDRGPTPPNVYDLSLRDHLFHGVRAIRLIPAGMGNMFGRDGMLAHTYMRGRSGQSNGCVSFSDYRAFLNVVQSGEINRLVVVEHLPTTPSPPSTSEWPPETVKALLASIQSASSGAAIFLNSGIDVTDDPALVEAVPAEPAAQSDD